MATTLRVLNVSRSTELADCAGLADGFFSRFRGLLGRDGLGAGEGLVIVPCTSVHMLGMRFPLDILHLDRQGTVVKILTNLKPGRLGPYVWRSHTVVELPAGTAAASGTQVGDQIELEPVA
ncbi:MAG: DUF192 domain-containing protein [Chloroflexota bacterium]